LIEAGRGHELRYFKKAQAKREYVALSQLVVDDPEILKSLLILSILYVTESDDTA
jgi:hypothetical protein